MTRRQTVAVAVIAIATAIAGVMHYAGASAVPTFVVAGIALAGPPTSSRSPPSRWASASAPVRRASCSRRSATCPSSSSCSSRSRRVRSSSRRPRSSARFWPTGSSSSDSRSSWVPGAVRAGSCASPAAAERHDDDADAGGVHHRHPRHRPVERRTAAEHAKTISAIAAVCLLVVYALWLRSYLRADTRGLDPAGGPSIGLARPRSRCSPPPASARRSSPTGSSPRSTPRSTRSASPVPSPVSSSSRSPATRSRTPPAWCWPPRARPTSRSRW